MGLEEILSKSIEKLSVSLLLFGILVALIRGYLVPAIWLAKRDSEEVAVHKEIAALRAAHEQELRELRKQIDQKNAVILSILKSSYEQRLADADRRMIDKEERFHLALEVLEGHQRTQEGVAALVQMLGNSRVMPASSTEEVGNG